MIFDRFKIVGSATRVAMWSIGVALFAIVISNSQVKDEFLAHPIVNQVLDHPVVAGVLDHPTVKEGAAKLSDAKNAVLDHPTVKQTSTSICGWAFAHIEEEANRRAQQMKEDATETVFKIEEGARQRAAKYEEHAKKSAAAIEQGAKATADSTTSHAMERAQAIEEEAENKAKAILAEAKDEAETIREMAQVRAENQAVSKEHYESKIRNLYLDIRGKISVMDDTIIEESKKEDLLEFIDVTAKEYMES